MGLWVLSIAVDGIGAVLQAAGVALPLLGPVMSGRMSGFTEHVSSFLHHVPDYLAMLAQASTLLAPRGQIFSFQDPLRYDSVGTLPKVFCDLAYLCWRLSRGDVVSGMRRRSGRYLAASVYDNAEYHVTRNGVDQGAICRLLEGRGLECRVVPYFSTQSRAFQALGSLLGVKNTFALLARRRPT